ncbi:hypothetical protein FZEAL_6481 [Fusarium zealandicum]|uniref:EngB-type G domain-containing protein n=1 Tax=Fusarium zealandicum TaxID=1053134 RepID=A0A8H4UHP0_9HYPO|nr:hypothetical protein FZEAL_6481 [Fusarium zealandicum]
MLSLRPAPVSRLTSLIPCSTSPLYFQSKATFSVSTRLKVRQRPHRRPSLRVSERPQRAANPGVVERSHAATPKPEDAKSQVEDPVKSTVFTVESKAHDLARTENGTKTPKAKATNLKSAPIRGMKHFQQELYQQDSVCYKKGAPVPAEAAQQDKTPLVAAEKFFEHGCRILYSAESFFHHAQNDHIPEIVVLGASNAGKSSFLNALVGGMKVAKVSHRPGKTTTMNAYGVGPRPKIARELVRKGDAPPKHSLVLMDTPGYGFKSQADWGKTILKYLEVRKMLRGAVVLIPADKKLQDTDRWMLRSLARSNTRTLVVITKADKRGDEWQDACHSMSTQIQALMQGLEKTQAAPSWREGSGRMLDIYATAANMDVSRRLGNGGGIGGVRLAILEMAGFSLADKIERQAETKAYSGQVVSFDDIVWKS